MMVLDPNTRQDFLSALISGNRIRCSEIAHETLDNNGEIINLYETLIKQSLYEVGKLWENNKISVATEHLATSVAEAILNELYHMVISEKRVNRKAIVACVENEYHQVGIKMVADIFEKNGWDTYFLGASTPVNELINFAQPLKPQAFALSLSIYFHMPLLEKMICTLQPVFPDIPILVGGQAFNHGGKEIIEKYKNVTLINDLNTLELFISKID